MPRPWRLDDGAARPCRGDLDRHGHAARDKQPPLELGLIDAVVLTHCRDAPIDLLGAVLGVVVPGAAAEERLLPEQVPARAHCDELNEIGRALATAAGAHGRGDDAPLIVAAVEPLARRQLARVEALER